MRSRIDLGLGVLLLSCVSPAVAGGDDLDDQITAANELAKAGKPDQALSIVTKLAAIHAEDPRIHYHQYRFLKQLHRLNEAADALEQAEGAFAQWRKRTVKNESIAALEVPITEEATEVLSFRRAAQKVTQRYRDQALLIAGKLSSSTEEPIVLSILEQLYRIDPSWLDQLMPIWGRTSLQSRNAHEQAQEKFRAANPEGRPRDSGLFDQKRSEAEKLLKAGKFKDSKTLALACLDIVPRSAIALVVLSEALGKMDQTEEAAVAALLAMDASKSGNENEIREIYDRAFNQLQSPELRSFARLKTGVAQELLELRNQAREAKRAYDEDWIERTAARLAPGDPVILAGIDKVRLGEESKRSIPSLGNSSLARGYVNLFKMTDIWRWENRSKASELTEDTLTLVPHDRGPMVEVSPSSIKLAKAFSLQFRLGYEIRANQEPWLYIVFDANRKSGNEENAVVLFPESYHVLCFASRRRNEPWVFRDRQPLPEGKARGSTGSQIDITWNDRIKKLMVTVDGEKALNRTLDEEDTLDGSWYIGLGGSAVKVQLKHLLLKNQD